MHYELADQFLSALSAIRIRPRRMLLETPGVAATVPMLRGVWGAALHDLDPQVYAAVFAPNDAPDGGRRAAAATATGTAAAAYVLRPAPPDPRFAPALDFILIGDAVQHDAMLCRAWDIASGMGLGPQRRRFHLRRIVGIEPDGQLADTPAPWSLDRVRWPAAADGNAADGNAATDQDRRPAVRPCAHQPAQRPCRLLFPVPLRLMARKQLIERPTLADLVVAAARRVRAYLPADRLADWDETSRRALETARETPAEPWQGERLDLHRYSGRQHAELELRGVTGWLDLPAGPGPLWPLLAAAAWLHLGKGTVMGMGQVAVGSGQ